MNSPMCNILSNSFLESLFFVVLFPAAAETQCSTNLENLILDQFSNLTWHSFNEQRQGQSRKEPRVTWSSRQERGCFSPIWWKNTKKWSYGGLEGHPLFGVNERKPPTDKSAWGLLGEGNTLDLESKKKKKKSWHWTIQWTSSSSNGYVTLLQNGVEQLVN